MKREASFQETADEFRSAVHELLTAMGIMRMLDWLAEKTERHWMKIMIGMWSIGIVILASMFIAGMVILIR